MSRCSLGIIGGGILGLCSAYIARQHGHSVDIYDQNGFPNENCASFLAGGMLAPYSEVDLITPEMVTAGHRSISFWRDYCCGQEGCFGYIETGSLFLAHQADDHMLDRFAMHLPGNHEKQIWAMKNAQDIAAIDTNLSHFKRGLHLLDEAALYPKAVMRDMCKKLATDEHVKMLQQMADPDVLRGQYDYVFDCRGSGANIDGLRGVKGELAVVYNPEFTLRHIVRIMHPRYPLYVVPRPGNYFMIGATIIESSGDDHVSVRSAMELLSALHMLHPSFSDAKIIHLQAGIRPAYSDNLPRIKRDGNILQINGSYRHGYLLGPILAQDALSIIENKHTTLFQEDAA